MGSYLNAVETKLTIAGKPCHFSHLTLNQRFNAHHTFEIKVDFQELDDKWMGNPIKIFRLMGQEITITMQHKESGDQNIFLGIIESAAMSGQHGEQNYIMIYGRSSTIRLDGTPTLDSFVDQTLKNTVNEAVDTSGNGSEVTVNPVFKGKIDYICQYKESAFDFLNRLSYLYSEWYFSDGVRIYFGKPDLGEAKEITYDPEIMAINFSAHLIPPKVKRYTYLVHDDDEISSDAPDTVDGVRGYIKVALDQSKSVYTSKATLPLAPLISNKKQLNDMVEAEKNRMVSNMLTISGSSSSCKIRIGKLIKVMLPKTMQVALKEVETFLVTEILHDIDQDGTYTNLFKGIPSTMENIPMAPIETPVAYPQIAWVKENVDEKKHGRIKVQFQWQKDLNKTTNWIRVQTVDSGTSGSFSKNRGHVFLPERNDQVMIGFEYGDPNRPYMTGSMFPERYAKGGEIDNNIKSIKTRSGHMLEFNDEVTGGWGITIKDDCGNNIHMSTKGKNIEITAPETITISAKNIQLNANENIKVSAGDDIIESAGKNKTDTAGETHITSAKNKKTFVDEDAYTQVKKNVTVDVLKNAKVNVDDDVSVKAGKLVVNVVDEDTIIKSTGKITLKSGDIIDVAQG